MKHEAARALIMSAWKAVFDASALKATFPVEYQNQTFSKPASGPWGRLTLLTADTEPASLGAKHSRTPFVLTLQVFLPAKAGTLIAYQAADVMIGLDGVVTRSPDKKVVVHFRTAGLAPGPEEDGLEAFAVTIRGHHDIYG